MTKRTITITTKSGITHARSTSNNYTHVVVRINADYHDPRIAGGEWLTYHKSHEAAFSECNKADLFPAGNHSTSGLPRFKSKYIMAIPTADLAK